MESKLKALCAGENWVYELMFHADSAARFLLLRSKHVNAIVVTRRGITGGWEAIGNKGSYFVKVFFYFW